MKESLNFDNQNIFLNIDMYDLQSYKISQYDIKRLTQDIKMIFNHLINHQQILSLEKPLSTIIRNAMYYTIQDETLIPTYFYEVEPFTPTGKLKKVPYLFYTNLTLQSLNKQQYQILASIYNRYDKNKELIRGAINFKIFELNKETTIHLAVYYNTSNTFTITSIQLQSFDGFNKQNNISLY